MFIIVFDYLLFVYFKTLFTILRDNPRRLLVSQSITGLANSFTVHWEFVWILYQLVIWSQGVPYICRKIWVKLYSTCMYFEWYEARCRWCVRCGALSNESRALVAERTGERSGEPEAQQPVQLWIWRERDARRSSWIEMRDNVLKIWRRV